MGEEYLKLVREANRHFDIADHMLFTTYPLINDTKLILTIIDNLYNALIKGIDALIQHNYYYKRISWLPDNFDGKIEVFKQISGKFGFERETIMLIRNLKCLVEHREKSPIEFSRSGGHVIADRNYRLKIVSFDKAKKHCSEAKVFIDKLNRYFIRK